MQCSAIQPLLSDYLDGSLSSAQARPVREHLDGCVRCRRDWEMLRATGRLVAHLGGETCPVDLRDSIERAICSGVYRR